MKRSTWTVAVLTLLFGTAIGVTTSMAEPSAAPQPTLVLAQGQSDAPPPALKTFTGTIMKAGDKFVLSDDGTHSSYQLDDQQSARKFDGKRVKVIGTLDAANSTIRVQSIEAAA